MANGDIARSDCPLCRNNSEYKYRVENNEKKIKENRENMSNLEEFVTNKLETVYKMLWGLILGALSATVAFVANLILSFLT